MNQPMAKPPAASPVQRLVRAVTTLSGFTMLSRVLGLLRDSLLNALIGPGVVQDAFLAALRLPNMFRQMFAEGAFSASFVPLFAQKSQDEGEAAAKQFASAVASILLLVLGIATIMAILFMRPIVSWMNPTPESLELTIDYARITSVYLLCMVMTALITGVLNSKQHFAAGAFAPIFFNILIIGGLLVSVGFLGLDTKIGGYAIAAAVAVAGVSQALFVWTIAALKFRFVLIIPMPRLTPDIKKLFALMGPGLIAAGGLQLNSLVGMVLALQERGGLSYLNAAERLYQLPIGLIAVAFGVAALPQLSGFFARNERHKAITTINAGIELAFLIAVPAALALMAIPDIIVRLLFQHGLFTSTDTQIVAQLVQLFALALPALAMQRVFNASFHGRKMMQTPMLLTLAGVVLNIALAIALFGRMGIAAIPIALGISAWIQMGLLAWRTANDGLWQPTGTSVWRMTAIVLAAISMAATVTGAKPIAMDWVQDSFMRLLVGTMALVALGILTYGTFLLILRGLPPEATRLFQKRN